MKFGLIVRKLKELVYPRIFGQPFFPKYNDSTLDWMNYSFCSPESRFPYEKQYSCRFALKQIKSTSPFLEVGVFAGRSTNFLTYLQLTLGLKNRLITTDPWDFTADKPITDNVSIHEYQNFIKEQFVRNMRFWHPDTLPESFDLGSDEFFVRWMNNEQLGTLFEQPSQLGGSISFCYLDGDHSYVQVKKDFENIDGILEQNGFIYFDDSDKYHLDAGEIRNGCYDVVQEALGSGSYEVAVQNPNYLLKKICSN